jgi:hypothetical protein
MVQIEPISIWSNGQTKTASELDARIINDDLKSSCTFYYELKEASTEEQAGASLAQGNVTIDSENYEGWDGSNDYAFQFIAEKINVTILVSTTDTTTTMNVE